MTVDNENTTLSTVNCQLSTVLMDYSQFKNLLQLKSIGDKESVPMLEELIEKFPYFQSARILLAKAMHEQQNIHYNDALKLAAAYATDREALRKLVAPPPSKGG